MLEFVLDILLVGSVYLIAFLGIVYVHELGHYLTGRFVVGIPRSEITIVMRSFPQHVALRGDIDWVGPSGEQYIELYEQYDPGDEHATTYIAAGGIIQTIAVVVAAVVFALSGLESYGRFLILFSLLLTLSYLVYDGIFTYSTGYPAGDFSALWRISPVVAVGTLFFVVILHAVVYTAI